MFNEEEYGLFKFKLPSESDKTGALNLSGESTTLKKILITDKDKFYRSVPVPLPGDHLMHVKEFGQTFSEFSNGQCRPVSSTRDTIYLTTISYGDKIKIDETFSNGLHLLAEAYFYGMKVKLIEQVIDLSLYDWESSKRVNKKTQQLQLCASGILKLLKLIVPDDAFALVAFTDQDLYDSTKSASYKCTEHETFQMDCVSCAKDLKSSKNSFCHSLANSTDRTAVFSFARMDPYFFTNKRQGSEDEAKFMKNYFFLFNRSAKLMVKEILHMFGLRNCIYHLCVMNGYKNNKEFDRRPLELCVICLRKLYSLIILKDDFTMKSRITNPYLIYERFIKLKDSIEENFQGIFAVEEKWYEARIKSIKEEL